MSPPVGPSKPPAPAEERALVARLRQGEAAAFEELVRAEGGRLHAVARRMLRRDDEARDAVQEAFIAAFRSIGGFEGGSRLSTWLHRIVVNACLMRLRSRKRSPEESLDELLPAFEDDGHQAHPAVAWSTPHVAAVAGERRRLVRACIDRLPETHRTVLLLRDVEEMDTAEVAAILGVSDNAVKIRLHRARQALRTLLDPHFRPEPTP